MESGSMTSQEGSTTAEDPQVLETTQNDPPKGKFKFFEMLAALSKAVKDGNLTAGQAKRIRAELGVSQAYFTRKQIPKAKRRQVRKAQKLARRTNRSK